ncbi:MAG: insulinase family protein [Candidatus Limnocylindrales bacterium]
MPRSCARPTGEPRIRHGRRSSWPAISAVWTSPLSPSPCLATGQRRRAHRRPRAGRSVSTPRRAAVGSSASSIDRARSRPEIRIGHRGLPRRIADFHALSVMSAILGGLFNSRLNMQLREAKGYTYGAGAGFDLRRGAGPFSARAAVNTEVTVPAILDTIAELERMRDAPVEASEARRGARDFLIGVFPLRFETAGAVAGALAGLAVHDLSIDELIDYRARIEAVDIDAVAAAARASTCTSIAPRSCSSATSTPSALRSRRPVWARSSSIATKACTRPASWPPMTKPRRPSARPTRASTPAPPPARRTSTSRAPPTNRPRRTPPAETARRDRRHRICPAARQGTGSDR